MRTFEKLWGILPKAYRRWLRDYMVYAGLRVKPANYFGVAFSSTIAVLLLSTSMYLLEILPIAHSVSIALVGSAAILLFVHGLVVVQSDRRTGFVEDILPDVLRILAANLRSGLTIDRALISSARPEFGFFEGEIKRAAHETLTGRSAEEALDSMTKKVRSKLLKRTIDLLKDGIGRGANLPEMLDGLAQEIREMKTLRREVVAHVMLYVIFIFFAAGIAAPLLYAITSFLIQTLTEIGARVEIPAAVAGELPITIGVAEIELSFLEAYVLAALVITSVFAGLLIGLVREGSERGGIKLIPVLLVLSLLTYYMGKGFVARMFGMVV
jgi:flagellar protein FlaJ